MKVIAVMSPKGGIGKTTTADSIAYILGEEQKKRVLVLDGDPQGDTSKTFGVYETEETGMSRLLEYHVCAGGECRTSELIWPTKYQHIDIIPANGYLVRTDLKLMMSQEENQITRLTEALAEVSKEYDYCICDCGRLFDMVVVNILIAAELIIAPVKVGGYENEAINNLCDQVKDLQDINPELKVKGILTMRQKKKNRKENAMKNVEKLFGEEAQQDKRIGEDIVKLLRAAVEEIYTGGLAKVTLNLRGGVKASVSQNSKGEINVERTETSKQKLTE